ncbi:MAG: DUF3553 domain-containing protein [Phycisphaerales bacterium]|nr:DUF3553 domain-containing protein [Phycisphaerales bacterium]
MSGTAPHPEADWSFGDRVRVPTKPEWGVGTVTRAAATHVRGKPCWTLTVRFPNAGIKMVNTSTGTLERVEDTTEAGGGETAMAIAEAEAVAGDDLLGPQAQRRVESLMVGLPEACTDPFRSIPTRVEATVDLYRFDGSGRALVDWAVAQTGLDDPLSRFNRQELETHFRKWQQVRDSHLAKLAYEARQKGLSVDQVLAAGPEEARAAAAHARFRR